MASPPKTVSNLVFYSHLPDKYILQLILFFKRICQIPLSRYVFWYINNEASFATHLNMPCFSLQLFYVSNLLPTISVRAHAVWRIMIRYWIFGWFLKNGSFSIFRRESNTSIRIWRFLTRLSLCSLLGRPRLIPKRKQKKQKRNDHLKRKRIEWPYLISKCE